MGLVIHKRKWRQSFPWESSLFIYDKKQRLDFACVNGCICVTLHSLRNLLQFAPLTQCALVKAPQKLHYDPDVSLYCSLPYAVRMVRYARDVAMHTTTVKFYNALLLALQYMQTVQKQLNGDALHAGTMQIPRILAKKYPHHIGWWGPQGVGICA